MIKDEGEFVTIAEAARRLGIAERQVRRYAAKLADSDRTTDRTVSGRERALVRLCVVADLAQRAKPDRNGQDTSPDNGPDTDRSLSGQQTLPIAAVSAAYERVITEQAARITDLKATVEDLQGQLRLAQENLAREQSLRLLSGSQKALEAGPEAPESDPPAEGEGSTPPAQEGGNGAATGRQENDSRTIAKQQQDKRRGGFWARLFGRREKEQA